MTLVDYASNFWGDKHIGYNVLYENMKKGEESVHELLTFLKERINVEDDLLKSLGKSLHRVNGYVSNNSGFVDAWKLARETLELWTEIQSTMLKNLNELLKEVTRYQEELGRMRKRAKDADTLETINLMQTTTTCLQKARDTYNQRCGEVGSLKQSNKEWTAASTREYLKARNKLNKAHEEYKLYMDKYSQIRDTFEERISNAARSFQEHDRLHLLQMKRFFAQLAKCFETGHGSHAQVGANLRQNVEQNINVEDLMLRFIDEKGTGTEPPQKLQWTEADELPPDLDVVSCVQSQSSSSNSSAIIPNPVSHQFLPSVNHLLGLDDSWMAVGGESGVCVGVADVQANASGSIGGGFGESTGSFGVKRGSANGFSEHNKSGCDSDSERHSEVLFSVPSSTISSTAPTTTSASSSSYVPLQLSSWLGRQKLSGRLKKHFSASQSNLAGSITIETPTVCGNDQMKGGGVAPTSSFSKSCNDTSSKMAASGLLKRYQKGKAMKSSMGDLTLIGKAQPELTLFSLDIQNNVTSEHEVVRDPLEVFGPPPPLPVTDPPSLDGELADTFSHYTVDLTRNYPATSSTKSHQQQIRQHSVSFVSTCSEGTTADEQQHQRCASSSSTSSDEEEACMAAQRSKIKQLQIRPLNDSQQSKLNASVDELRMAIGQISLSKCKGCENDPWGGDPTAARDGPIRAALTGDEQHLRRKYNEFPFSDFSQSVAALSAGSTISRARPRSHTPLPSRPFGVPGSSTPFFGTEPKRSETPSTPTPSRPIQTSQTTPSSIVPLSVDNELSTPSVTPYSFETPATLCGGPFAQNFFISPSSMAIHPSASFSASSFKVPGTVPIAMAVNEYLHVWIKPNCALRPSEIRLFGTLTFSLRGDSLAQLTSTDSLQTPLRFTLKGAEKLKMIVPNKMFLNESNALLPSRDCHQFAVDRQKLADFLRERMQNCTNASFFNADLLRYELPLELAPSPLPLHFSSRWIRYEKTAIGDTGAVELRIDYQWSKIGESAPQNVVFSTKVNTQSCGDIGISLLSSEPSANWIEEHCVLNWEFREFPSSSVGGGALKAVFKCVGELTPANTYVQFQVSDTSLSAAHIVLDDQSGFALSVFKKKLQAGKYFCEPAN